MGNSQPGASVSLHVCAGVLSAYIEENQMREIIDMACTLCKQRNYSSMKNKKNDPDRLERNKFCKFCRKHTPHKEVK